MINRVSSLREVALSTLIGAAMTLAPSKTLANGGEAGCPPEWEEYVAQVREIVAPLQGSVPIVFVSREGEAYDCLGLIRNDEFLEQASDYLRYVPYDRSPINLSDSANWPINVCSVAETQLPHLPFFHSIDLPLQETVLELPVCERRVLGGVRRIVARYQND